MKKMLKILFLWLLTLSITLSFIGCGTPGYSVANFKVYDEQLSEVELEDYIGKPIVINFWATWCGYCKLEMPDFNDAYNDHPNVQFMMVNNTDGVRETVKTAMDYVEACEYDFPIFFDTTLQAAQIYEVEAFPTTLFIDKNGDLVKRKEGAMDRETLEEYLALIDN